MRLIESLAQASHMSLKTWLYVRGEPYAIPRWENLSIEDREFGKTVTANIMSDIGNLQPKDVHEIWFTQRAAMGYRLGARRNRRQRTHPNMVSWDELHGDEQVKSKIILETLRLLGTIPV